MDPYRLFALAWRNVLRNSRRTALTVSAVAISTTALILFSGLVGALTAGLETNLVQKVGHFRIYKNGHPSRFGAGNPAIHKIDNVSKVMGLIKKDPVIGPKIRVVTPVIFIAGIVRNEPENVTRTFFGQGLSYKESSQMKTYNPYNIRQWEGPEMKDIPLAEDDAEGGVIGLEMLKLLQLCDEMPNASCQDKVKGPKGNGQAPELELFGATADGSPKRLTLKVRGARKQDSRVGDEFYTMVTLPLARNLIYDGDPEVASVLGVQLKTGKGLPETKAQLQQLLNKHKLGLEVRDLAQIWPQYPQVRDLLDTIFLFLGFLMGSTVLFTVGNTMTMNVMERVQEIGQLRAMGLRRRGILAQFLTEGTLLGLMGALMGLLIAWAFSTGLNAYGVTWEPPGSESPVYVTILLSNNLMFVGFSVLMMAAAAALSSIPPARRASKMVIVDALRHV